MQPQYAKRYADFVENLVRRMDSVVYGDVAATSIQTSRPANL